jgi:membrane protease YdiL (CAAX protease family)
MTIFTTLLSPIFSYVRIKAKSVIAAAIIHGTLNATYGISIMLIKGGNDLTAGEMGLAGFIALALINLALLLYDRKIEKEPIMNAI